MEDVFIALLVLESGYMGGKLVVVNQSKETIYQEQLKGPLASVFEQAAARASEMSIDKTYVNHPLYISKMVELALESKDLKERFILA